MTEMKTSIDYKGKKVSNGEEEVSSVNEKLSNGTESLTKINPKMWKIENSTIKKKAWKKAHTIDQNQQKKTIQGKRQNELVLCIDKENITQ